MMNDKKDDVRPTAKSCFGHLGGKLGSRLFERLIELEWFELKEGKSTVYTVTEKGCAELAKLGVKFD
jgi:predicted transcriptional regulator